jgi:penicillin-binding protein 2
VNLRHGKSKLEAEKRRVRIAALGMLVAFSGLAAALYYVQVAHGARYETNLERQSVRRVRVPGMRGRILDRQERVLADNRASICLAVYLEELRLARPKGDRAEQIMELVETLRPLIAAPPAVDRDAVRAHLRDLTPLPLVLWRDISEQDLARFAEQASTLPGVDTLVEPVRVYPERSLAAHVIGYVGRDNMQSQAKRSYHYYTLEMIGRAGVEKVLDEVLRGREGGRLLRVDVGGYRHEDLGMNPARPGGDVQLSIDADIQQLAEEAIRDIAGAAVVVDPRNGDVLALASSPSYDLNQFVPFLPTTTWKAMREHPGHPMVNRASGGMYTPGSVFKPVVALAGLENGLLTPEDAYFCPGHYVIGGGRKYCWLHRGHGLLDLQGAIQHSCNVYFFHASLKMGHETIVHMAQALGLGQPTGIALDVDVPGLVPDEAWKRGRIGDGWRAGDTLNLSIGQGWVTVTPLQMAMVTAALANQGTLYAPRLVLATRPGGEEAFRAEPPVVANRLNWSERSRRVVREGMYDVVMSPTGTGRLARVPGIEVAGKTGTAEYGPSALNKKRGWMIAFAPFREPRYAVAVVVDDAEGGGSDSGPRLQRILAGLFGVPPPDPSGGAGDG